MTEERLLAATNVCRFYCLPARRPQFRVMGGSHICGAGVEFDRTLPGYVARDVWRAHLPCIEPHEQTNGCELREWIPVEELTRRKAAVESHRAKIRAALDARSGAR